MYLLDTANIKMIKRFSEHYAFKGITTNPTLMSRENRTDFLHHIKEIKDTVPYKRVFVQVNSEKSEEMIEEAQAFGNTIDQPWSVKIPATLEGYRAMQALSDDLSVAATAVVDFHQALMSIEAGASTVIIYVNRMISSGLRPFDLIGQIRSLVDRENLSVSIMGASFKSHEEVARALSSGAHHVTVSPVLFERMFLKPLTQRSVSQFTQDFKDRYQTSHIKKG